VSQWWSWSLSVAGATGYLLVVRGVRWGVVVGLLCQGLWLAYAVTTRQWGFLFSVGLFSAVNTYGLVRWRAEVRAGKRVAHPAS